MIHYSNPPGFSIPRRAVRQARTATFRMSDGMDLGCVVHEPLTPRHTGIVYVHGIESHAAWFDAVAGLLADDGYPVCCMDRRGSGINRENRGHASGDVPADVDLLDDLHMVLRGFRAAHPRLKAVVLIGLSWGGKYAYAYAVRHAREVAGLVLLTPAIKPKVDLGWGEKVSVLLEQRWSPATYHRVPIHAAMFTDTPHHQEWIRNDPLRLRSVTARFLWQSRRLDRMIARAPRLEGLPVLAVLAGRDRIIDNPATRRFLTTAVRPPPVILDYGDQTHSIQLDAPERLVRDLTGWLEPLAS